MCGKIASKILVTSADVCLLPPISKDLKKSSKQSKYYASNLRYCHANCVITHIWSLQHK